MQIENEGLDFKHTEIWKVLNEYIILKDKAPSYTIWILSWYFINKDGITVEVQ